MRFASKLGLTAIAAALIIGPLLGAAVFLNARSILEQRIVSDQVADARQIMREIDTALYRGYNDVRMIAADELLREYVESPGNPEQRKMVAEEMEQREALTGPWLSMMVLTVSGKHLISVGGGGGHGDIGHYPLSAPIFRQALAGRVVWSDRVLSDHAGKPTVIFGAPVFSRTDPKRVVGVVIAHYDWHAVRAVLDEVDPEATVHLLNRRGEIIGKRSNDRGGETDSQLAKVLRRQQPFGDKAGYLVTDTALHGHSRALVVDQHQTGMKGYRGSGWNLVIERPIDKIFQPIKRLAWQTTGLVFAGVLLLGALYMLVSRRFLAPLSRLVEGVRDVGRGDFSGHLTVRSRDEFGELAEHFNTMVGRLRQSTVSRNHLDRILNTMEGSVVVLTPDYRISDLNSATLEMLGHAPGTLDGQPFTMVMAEAPTVLAPLQEPRGATQVTIAHYETGYTAADGHTVPVQFSAAGMHDANGRLEAMVCAAVDITERKRAEEALVSSEERFRNLVESTGDFVWEVNVEGLYTYVSPQVEKLLGYRPEEMIGKTPFEDMPEEEAERVADNFRDAVRRRQPIVALENANLHRDGRLVVLETSGMPFFGHDDEFLGYRGIDRDITERKRAEELAWQQMQELRKLNDELVELNAELERAQSQLVQSEKMASIGVLAAGVAHEINNPVGYLQSNLESMGRYIKDFLGLIDRYDTLEASLPADDPQRAAVAAYKAKIDLEYLKQDATAMLAESRQGIDRIKTIVQDLKSFSHVDAVEMWRMEDLHKALETTLNVVWNELKYKCEVVKEYGELPLVECRISQLQQVFMNLLVNAAQAIEEHGIITIRTGTEDDQVWIEVSDDGKGIPEDQLARVFEPFYTTKPVGKGTGLGLSVSYNIVERHHGRLEVESEEGGGTTFRIHLPVRQSDTSDVA